MRVSKRLIAMAPCAFVLGIGGSSTLISSVANAEDAANAAAAPAKKKPIEEITVFARRTAESLQDVPVAVTAFTEADITRVAPRTLRDFDGLAPNVRIGMNTAGPSAGAIFIRGIGYADIEKTQTPSVSIIIDGIQQGSSTGQLVDTFDLAQLEILRGPQGVLQGKNTTGGAIIVSRIKPNLEKVDYGLSLQAGSFNEQQLKGRVSYPLITDTLALKIGGILKKRDGYYSDSTLNRHPGKIDYNSETASLLWQPNDKVTSQWTYDRIKDRGEIPPQDPRIDGSNPFKNKANIKEPQKYDVDSITWNVNADVGIGTFTSNMGASQANDSVVQDFDGATRGTAAVPLVQLHTLREQKYRQFSEELKLNGNFFTDKLHYTVGAFFFGTNLKFRQGTNLIVQLPSAAFGLPAAANCQIPTEGGPIVLGKPNPVLGGGFCQLPQSFNDQHSGEKVKSEAGFAALNWNVTDSIELSVGARALTEEKDFNTAFGTRLPSAGPKDAQGDPLLPPTTLATIFPGFPVTGNHGWNKTVTRYSGSWSITDSNKLYASYSTGFRSGGFSIRGTDPNNLSFDPEDDKALEIGSKNELFDGRVRINVAAFRTLLKKAQFSSILTSGPPGTNTVILNATGDYKVYGLEFEGTWAITDEFSLNATYGYQHTKGEGDVHSCLVRVFNPDGSGCNAAQNPALFVNGVPIANLPTVKAPGGVGFASPKFNWALVATYATQFGGNPFSASVIAKATDDVFLFALPNAAGVQQPAFVKGYTLVDANISYEYRRTDKDSITFSLTGKNLADKEYVEQELPLGNGGFRGWGPPRQVAFEVLWRN